MPDEITVLTSTPVTTWYLQTAVPPGPLYDALHSILDGVPQVDLAQAVVDQANWNDRVLLAEPMQDLADTFRATVGDLEHLAERADDLSHELQNLELSLTTTRDNLASAVERSAPEALK